MFSTFTESILNITNITSCNKACVIGGEGKCIRPATLLV